MHALTASDWKRVLEHSRALETGLPDRVLAQLGALAGYESGFPVDRLQHSLQCATLAHEDGKPEPYVVAALLHDIGDLLAPANHAEYAAALLRPYVSERIRWVIEKHSVFQGYYYYAHLGRDPNARERYRDHPYYPDALEFCERYEIRAFEPGAPTMSLDDFEPMVRRVLRDPWVEGAHSD